jgi:anti-sigma regulatory factor (Ser/Thr protein kinase)
MRDSVELCLRRDESAPARARAAIGDLADGQVPDERRDMALLLTSEVVTNALLHARPSGDIELHGTLKDGHLRVEVLDQGPGFGPPKPRSSSDRPGGYGLRLLEAAATRWGTSRGDRFTVWFELAAR